MFTQFGHISSGRRKRWRGGPTRKAQTKSAPGFERQPGRPICRQWIGRTSCYFLLGAVSLPFDQKDKMDSGYLASLNRANLVEPTDPFGIMPRKGEGMASISERITVNPDQCGGRPCVRRMRIRVTDVLDLLANGLTPEQVLVELPDLEREDIRACLKFASGRINHPMVVS